MGELDGKNIGIFFLFNIISIVMVVIDGATRSFSPEAGIGLPGGIYALAVLIPSIAASVCHFHDTDRSGWWVLMALIPLIGTIVLLVFMVQDSNTERNQFGENPKEDAT